MKYFTKRIRLSDNIKKKQNSIHVANKKYFSKKYISNTQI